MGKTGSAGAHASSMSIAEARRFRGHLSRGFDVVGDTFNDNFDRCRELGGAICAYYQGEKVVRRLGSFEKPSSITTFRIRACC